MPRLTIFGREVTIGSDDVAIPAAFEAAASIACMCSLGHRAWRSFSAAEGLWDSLAEYPVTYFLLGHGLLITANFGVLLANIHISLKGTLINTYPRRHINKAIKAKVAVEGARVIFSAVATKWAYVDIPAVCSPMLTSILQRLCHVSLGLTVWGLLSIKRFVHMEPHIHRLIRKKEACKMETDVTVEAALYKKWSTRVHRVAEFLQLESDVPLHVLADLSSDFFKEDVDIVASDILVALILLDRKQEKRRREFDDRMLIEPDPRHSPMDVLQEEFPPLESQVWMRDIHLVSHFMHYAMGAYGWPYFILRSPLGVLDLASAYIRNRRLPKGTLSDPLTLITRTVIKKTTELEHEDIIYISVANTCFTLPFFVALDHKYKRIVVTIRGTLSMEDVLVDLTAAPADEEDLVMPGLVGGAARVHSGMLRCARTIHSRLVEPCTDNPDGRPLLELAREKLRMEKGSEAVKEYGVLVTGHSLGAGTAGLLALLLHANMPVECIAYSCPGGLVSLNLARYMERFTLSVVLGADVVARIGLVNAWNLKINLLNIIKDCDIPKYEIVGSWLEGMFALLVGQSWSRRRELLQHESWNGHPEAEELVLNYQAHIQTAIESARACRDQHPQLYMPGCVLYVEEQKTRGWLFNRNEYCGTFVRGDSQYFDEIMLQKCLIDHHAPWNVETALSWMSNQNIVLRHVGDSELRLDEKKDG